MLTDSRKHRILSTHPLSATALNRLSLFFDVRVACDTPGTGSGNTVDLLKNTAGVITSLSTLSFEKSTIEQLPHLRAICLVDAPPRDLDLSVLTQAGIRATGLPEELTDQNCVEEWTILMTEVQNHPPRNPPPDGNQLLKRFSGSLFTAGFHALRLGLLGPSARAHSLFNHAARAGVRMNMLEPHELGTQKSLHLDWLVIPSDWTRHGGRTLDEPDLQALPAHCRIIDFSENPAFDPMATQHPRWLGRIIHKPITRQPPELPADPTTRIAEQLIAALGFGRCSWHPENLLNPDVCCESCC